MEGSRAAIHRGLRAAFDVGRYIRHRIQPDSTYAANYEDVAALLLLENVDRFIDVGANNGITVSNTALFALRGACGLCFEPNPADYRRLSALYRFAGHVECIEEGLSDKKGVVELRSDGLLSSITATEDQGLTTLLTGFYSADQRILTVKIDELSSWIDRRPRFACSDVISVDVEGHELNVLNGIAWTRHPKPSRCFIIETHSKGGEREWLHRDYGQIDALLGKHAYLKLAASANNTIWLHSNDADDSRIKAAKIQFPSYRWFR